MKSDVRACHKQIQPIYKHCLCICVSRARYFPKRCSNESLCTCFTLSQVLNDGLVGNLIKLKYIVLVTTFIQHSINRTQHKISSQETGY